MRVEGGHLGYCFVIQDQSFEIGMLERNGME